MSRSHLGLVVLLSCTVAVPLTLRATVPAAAPISRTVYVSVLDKEGKAVPGLTPADFTVKEAGKEREITSVALPTARMKLALLVEEALTPDTVVRQGMLDFARRLAPIADVAIIAAGIKNTLAVDYTTDVNKLVTGLNSIAMLQGRLGNHMPEGIYDLAKGFQQSKPERPVIVAVALEVDQASAEDPDKVLNDLRLSRALFIAVAVEVPSKTRPSLGDLAEASGRSKVLGEGTKQSGGRRIGVLSTRGVAQGLQEAAGDLEAQYLITYALPDGVKPSDRIQVSTSRKNVNLLAPTRVNDK